MIFICIVHINLQYAVFDDNALNCQGLGAGLAGGTATPGQDTAPVPPDTIPLTLFVNGQEAAVEAAPLDRLSTVLRGALGLTGVKEGCCEGECGACTVMMDGLAVHACLTPAIQAGGRTIATIEGLADGNPLLSGLQQAFLRHGAVQCGYCTPGMVMAAEALLAADPAPDDAEIRHALAGNICRCTGFQTIVDAIADVAARRRDEPAA